MPFFLIVRNIVFILPKSLVTVANRLFFEYGSKYLR